MFVSAHCLFILATGCLAFPQPQIQYATTDTDNTDTEQNYAIDPHVYKQLRYQLQQQQGLKRWITQGKQSASNPALLKSYHDLQTANAGRQVQDVNSPYRHQLQTYQAQHHQSQHASSVGQSKALTPSIRAIYVTNPEQATKYVRPADGSRQPILFSRPQQQEKEEEPEDFDPNPSYQFGFDVTDDLHTNYQNRKEQREGGKITGSYSVVDSDGYIRTVTYTADPKEGFKADVQRQPTDIVVKIPKPDPTYVQATQQQPSSRQQTQTQIPNYLYRYQ